MDAKSGAVRPHAEVAHFEMFSRGYDGVHWRLVSANNRDSGQGGSGFPDVESCRSAIDRMLSLLGEMRPLYTLAPDHRWHWTLALNDEVLAKSSRSFDRRLRCLAASQWFLRAAPNASIRGALRVARARAPDQGTADLRRPFTPPADQIYSPDPPSPVGDIVGLGGLTSQDLVRPAYPGRLGQPDGDRKGG
jgi:hypothetical protein